MARKTKNIQYYEGVGRRRESVARVRLYITGKEKSVLLDGLKEGEKIKAKAGEIHINGADYSLYFPLVYDRAAVLQPLKLTDTDARFVISIHTSGGGRKGQRDAIILGISRALNSVDKDEYRGVLKKAGLLTRDPRIRERRKVGTGGKARRQKQSPKR